MRTAIVRFLRWLAVKLGGESDLDYRGRILNVIRRLPERGTRESYEQAIEAITPPAFAVEFEWPDRSTLVVKFRGGA